MVQNNETWRVSNIPNDKHNPKARVISLSPIAPRFNNTLELPSDLFQIRKKKRE